MKKAGAVICLVVLFTVGIIAHGPKTAQAALALDFTADVSAQGLVENGGPATFGAAQGFTTVGWYFTPTVDIYVLRLGLFDADRDRRHSEDHQVAIWSAGNTTPLVSVIVHEGPSSQHTPETSPHGALFHFESLGTPAILYQGRTYYIGATLYAGLINGSQTTDFDSFASFSNGESPIFISPYIIYGGNAYGISASNTLAYPSSSLSGVDYTIGANMDITPVPLPAAAWLFGSGLTCLFFVKRRMA